MVAVLLLVWIGAGAIVYSPEYVVRVLRSRKSSVQDYLINFPARPLSAPETSSPLPTSLDEEMVGSAFALALGVDDLDAFLEDSETQAVVVLHDGAVVFERYANGTQRDSMVTSFSVAKSVDSVLIGIAIDEGFIGSVDDPITGYLPELADRDPAFSQITVHDVLRMAAGLEYQELRWWLFNGDDPLTTYHPDQREITLENTEIESPPGRYFDYNKYHPQMLGMILERATGMSVTEYTQTRLWDPMGMEFDGAWTLDSTESGFEKMEAGLNARAIDFARFGQMILQDGWWNGQQIVPAEWIETSTALDPTTHDSDYYSRSFGPWVYDDGAGYYQYMWYGRLRADQPADILALGDHGQIIYISPATDVVIVRNGFEYGIALEDWVEAMTKVADSIGR